FQKKILLPAQDLSDLDKSFRAEALDTAAEYRRLMENVQLSDAVKVVWKFIGRANKYIDETAPWKLAKDETQRQNLANVLYNLAEALRIVSILISPFMPATADKIRAQLNVAQEIKLDDAKIFGQLEANHEVSKPEQLFPRILIDK
ncbi:MAG: class I tRNA ligase family protein, partial [Selenomonadaceae bacterium]|nr:class I tRNA ligase family protein [Selenomonadaceae bacterium]